MIRLPTFDDDAFSRLDTVLLPAAVPPPEIVSPLAKQAARRHIIQRILKRKYEGLRFYEPLPLAEKFHQCNAMWRLIDGSNRSGKTIAATVEAARALTGQDPYDKYPRRDGHAWFVGLKMDHLALLYRNMFCEGAFLIIPDEHTGLYRALRFNPSNPTQLLPYDAAYQEKSKSAPPLIPPRMVTSKAFHERNKDQPAYIRISTGWVSQWDSAMGDPQQGFDFDYVGFDEEMPNPAHYSEAHRGLTRLAGKSEQHRPKGVWAATSQVNNPELAELRDKSELDPESDFVRRFTFLVEQNPYVSPAARLEMLEGFSEEEKLTRYYGIPSLTTRHVYSAYNPMENSEDGGGHGCEPYAIDPKLDCRYVVIDPSITRTAVLFVAIDPLEQYLTIYDGFELSRATARTCAFHILERQQGVKFEAIVFDQQMGKESHSSRGELVTVAGEYSAAMKEVGVQVRRYGSLQHYFIPGSNNVEARTLALQTAMEVRGSGPFEGTCRLRVMRGIVPALDKEIRRAATDPKNPKKRFRNPQIACDFLDDLEYAAAGDLGYHAPEITQKIDAPPNAYQMFRQSQARQRRRNLMRA